MASEIPGQYVYCRIVIANELRRLGIDPPADLQPQSNQESVNEEEPELGLVSQQSFPTSSLSLLRDPIFSLGEQVHRLMGHMISYGVLMNKKLMHCLLGLKENHQSK